MPALPSSLSNPGLVIALCLVVGLVIGVNATLLSLIRRGPGRPEDELWSRAFGGARDRLRQPSAQLDELHRAVSELPATKPDPQKSDE